MVKITVNTETVNNTIPTTILLDKATTNNSLDEEEVGRVETGLGEDEKVKLKEEEILSVEDELDEEDRYCGSRRECCGKIRCKSTKEPVYGVLYVKIIN